MDEEQKHEPQISLPTGVFIWLAVLVLDIVDWLEVGLPATDAVSWATTQLYLYFKGLSGSLMFSRMLIGNLLELIPVGDYLPIRTVVWTMVLWLDRHPKAAKVTEAIGAGASAGAGVARKGIQKAGARAAEQIEQGVAQEAVQAERSAAEAAARGEGRGVALREGVKHYAGGGVLGEGGEGGSDDVNKQLGWGQGSEKVKGSMENLPYAPESVEKKFGGGQRAVEGEEAGASPTTTDKSKEITAAYDGIRQQEHDQFMRKYGGQEKWDEDVARTRKGLGLQNENRQEAQDGGVVDLRNRKEEEGGGEEAELERAA